MRTTHIKKMENKKSQRVYRVVMLVLITSIITFLITAIAMYNKFSSVLVESSISGNSTGSNETGIIKTLNQFKTILSQKYIGEINEEELTQGAIKGYIEGLGDPYTEYLTKEEMSELMETTSGKYVGIGVYVANNTENDTILVAGVMKGSPALEAGMLAGDIITKVDGVQYKGSALTEATNKLKGEEGTTAKVTILREEKEIELTVTRKTITVQHVASKTIENNIGYIQIDAFDDGVADEFEKQLKSLQESGIKGLIIDLRSNGGGVVDEATDIASLFTEKGNTVLITKAKNEQETLTKSKVDKLVKDIPVVVLVNSTTASASEILAGSLRDNYGAIIVGKNTYGKGVIQTVYSLSDGSGIKITTDEYFTPKHTAINKVGIAPDEEVSLTKDDNGNYQTEETNDAQLLKAIETIKDKTK